jgi:hypothetical protein
MNDATAPSEQQTAPPPIDPSVLKSALTEVMTDMHTQQQQQPREMTPEQQAEYYAVFDPAADNFHESFYAAAQEEDPVARARAIGALRDGIVNQSLRGAELLIEQRMQQLMPQLAPAIQMSKETSKEKLWSDFSSKHPELSDHREIVDLVSTQLSATGFKPKNLDEGFTRVAEVAKGMLTKLNVAFSAPSTNQQRPNSSMPRMSTHHTGGGGGATRSDAAPAGSNIASFFHNRRR